MATVDVVVTDLTFPSDLKDAYCKFRPIISIRYKDSNDKLTYAREALPGLGPKDYWECEKGNKKKPNYVRHASDPKVDMVKLDVAQREVVFSGLDVRSFERIEVEILDIDVLTDWEKRLRTGLKMVPSDVLDKVMAQINDRINKNLPVRIKAVKEAIEKAQGRKLEDVEKILIDKARGQGDGSARSIWGPRSQDLTNPPQQTVTITGPGKQGKGDYSVTLKIEVS